MKLRVNNVVFLYVCCFPIVIVFFFRFCIFFFSQFQLRKKKKKKNEHTYLNILKTGGHIPNYDRQMSNEAGASFPPHVARIPTIHQNMYEKGPDPQMSPPKMEQDPSLFNAIDQKPCFVSFFMLCVFLLNVCVI